MDAVESPEFVMLGLVPSIYLPMKNMLILIINSTAVDPRDRLEDDDVEVRPEQEGKTTFPSFAIVLEVLNP